MESGDGAEGGGTDCEDNEDYGEQKGGGVGVERDLWGTGHAGEGDEHKGSDGKQGPVKSGMARSSIAGVSAFQSGVHVVEVRAVALTLAQSGSLPAFVFFCLS